MTFLTTILLLVTAPSASLEALQITGQAFGGEVVMAVADLPPAAGEEALRRALEEIRRVEALTDPDGQQPGGLGRLNAAAGGGQVTVEPQLARLLVRALYFCRWSEGANGPLGGHLYRQWTQDGGGEAPPPEALAPALAATGCDGLAVDVEAGAATLAADRLLDLRTFASGHAADRAVVLLQEAGAGNGFVKVGEVTRAFGPGPGGRGWPVAPPDFPGLVEPLERVWLRDQALAIASREDGGPATGASRGPAPYIDQRRGRPAEGVVATLAVSELGVDAQGLATTLFIIGSRNGQLLLGGLRPRPSVLWLLGSGAGHPLLVDYRWSEVGR